MSRSLILLVLFSVWTFAIFAPPLISVLSEDGKSLVSNNLSEEEEQEQGKKNMEKKEIVSDNPTNFSLLSQLQDFGMCDFYLFVHSDYLSEVVPPPPKYTI